MIMNLPTSEDYFQSGRELLNFAWDTTSDLLTEFDQADYYGFAQEEISEQYWAAAKRTLTTSLAIVQQGVEFLLKGKIAEISPYLLISDPPSRWPSPYENHAIDFSTFRTVDAQDLIRIHDTFSILPLSISFAEKFHSLRERRNVIMHSPGNGITVHVTEVIEAILFVYKALFPKENWPTIRRKFLERGPNSELGGGDYATNRACWEISIILSLLKPTQVKAFLGIDPKQRAYFCPKCLNMANTDAGFDFPLAVLRPKSISATRLYCPVCNEEHEVKRQGCEKKGCPGNVIDPEYSTCLTCGF